eukprot:GAFH01003437.1.p1 GENE.GAFH01003437.1~~GAFH01003437.1.p1  ORF type:complete len:298 (-),score=29.36 GAFH01003437.1:52-822(-)
MNAAEGRSGNISVHLDLPADYPGTGKVFQFAGSFPHLVGQYYLVKVTSTRLWMLATHPEEVMCLVRIVDEGRSYEMLLGAGKPTSEIAAHFGIYETRARLGLPTRAVIHAQPQHITALTLTEPYGNNLGFNRLVYRQEPETALMIPEGIAVLPYLAPGSEALAEATGAATARGHRVIVWAKHGIIACHPEGLMACFDLIDYVEAAARLAYTNMAFLTRGEISLHTVEDLRALAESLHVQAPVLDLIADHASATGLR